MTKGCVRYCLSEMGSSSGRADEAVMETTARDAVSHELRTPLTIIQMGVDLLSSDDVDGQLRAAILAAMDHATQRLRGIVACAEAVADAWVAAGYEDFPVGAPVAAMVSRP